MADSEKRDGRVAEAVAANPLYLMEIPLYPIGGMMDAKQLKKWAVWRIIPCRPGCIDFCGTIDQPTMHEAEMVARLMFPCSGNEYLSIEPDDE